MSIGAGPYSSCRLIRHPNRPDERFLIYHDPDYQAFGADAFDVDLDKYPMAAYAGTTRQLKITFDREPRFI